MRKILIIGLLSVLISSCSEKDNYSSPGKTLQGAIIDQETGDSIPSQQLNGLRVRLYDQQYNNPQPIDFWGKQDGSFKNSKLFGGKYRMIVDNGGFYPLDTTAIDLPREEDVTIEALPYLRVSIDAQPEGENSIIVKYKLTKTKPEEGKIERRAVFVNTTHYVDFNNFVNNNPIVNTEDEADSELTTRTFKDTISDLKPNTTYFVRVAGRTDNVGDHYNYSKVVEVKIP